MRCQMPGAELGLDLGTRFGERKGGQAVLQEAQLLDQLGADDVAPGRQHLAELDIGRPHRLQRAGDRRQRRVARAAKDADRPGDGAHGEALPAADLEGVEQDPHRAGALEGRPGAQQAPEMVGRAQQAHGSWLAGCSLAGSRLSGGRLIGGRLTGASPR